MSLRQLTKTCSHFLVKYHEDGKLQVRTRGCFQTSDEIDDVIKMLYNIMRCSVNCSEADHYRHHEFVKDYQLACNTERTKYGFGYKAFNEECVEWVTNRVKDTLLETHSDSKHPYTKRRLQIKKLGNCALTSLFQKHSMLAHYYSLHVATKEALVFLRAIQNGWPYEVANKICQDSEVDIHRITRGSQR